MISISLKDPVTSKSSIPTNLKAFCASERVSDPSARSFSLIFSKREIIVFNAEPHSVTFPKKVLTVSTTAEKVLL